MTKTGPIASAQDAILTQDGASTLALTKTKLETRGKRIKGQQDKDNKTKTTRQRQQNKVGKTYTTRDKGKSKEPRHKRREIRYKSQEPMPWRRGRRGQEPRAKR